MRAVRGRAAEFVSNDELALDSTSTSLLVWLQERRSACDMHVELIPRSDSREWCMTDGRIVRRLGGFFSVVGLEASGPGIRRGLEQPMIDQPEVGILGFALRAAGESAELLVQAKPEPGNVGRVQLAPSVQATRSNFLRRHGGRPTPLLQLFDLAHRDALSDTLQSEQGTRFRAKYNRNMVVRVSEELDGVGDHLRWFPVEHMLNTLLVDFGVNTDARSVLATCPWPLLARDGAPFARWRGASGLGDRLSRSYRASGPGAAEVLAWLGAVRVTHAFETRILPIDRLGGWRLDDWRVYSTQHLGLEVRHVRVASSEREVESWDQPLLWAASEGAASLLCQERDGILQFLFVARAELGFTDYAQLGPSHQRVDGPPNLFAHLDGRDRWLAELVACACPIVSCLQSDEGGRFLHSVSRYTIAELTADTHVPPLADAVWLTAGQISGLVGTKGAFTNEARSLISLIVAFV